MGSYYVQRIIFIAEKDPESSNIARCQNEVMARSVTPLNFNHPHFVKESDKTAYMVVVMEGPK